MGKPEFCGLVDRHAPKHLRHTYAKHQIGPDKRTVFVKLPNIERMKTTIMARKLLYMNYVFGKRKNHYQYVNAEDWDEDLRPARKHCRRQLKDTSGQNNRQRSHNLKNSTSETFPENNEQDTHTASSEPVLLDIPNEIVSSGPLTDNTETGTAATNKNDYESEDWQQRHFGNQIKADLWSNEITEVMANLRMTTLNTEDLISAPLRTIIFMEAIWHAVGVHDWLCVAKCVEGIATEAQLKDKTCLLWNAGFLAIIHLSKDQLSLLTEFAQSARNILRFYPRRFGIELATWFTQKGFFTDGLFLLEEWHDELGKGSWWNRPTGVNNPKRHIIDLIALLYGAVYQYLIFKRDVQLYEENKYTGDEDSLSRSGERALALFEGVLELSQSTDSDVTIFIEPLIELVLRFRSDERAKEIFESVCGNNFRNAVLQEMYIKFLKEHFPFLEEEIKGKEIKFDRFTFKIRKEDKKSNDLKVKTYLKNAKPTDRLPFRKIENPGFSW